ncbi:hypothetical protein KEJ39_02525 [Candidatus Bathyarchaeota archaeon]|nr:hypothetical protein [Candidatus Bathyarchaeota archaeon]
MDTQKLYRDWLILLSLAIILGGMIIAFSVEPYLLPLEEAFVSKWLLGLLGATVMGWAASMLLVSRYAFDQQLPQLLRMLLVGLLVWFVPDTLISAYFCAYFNVAINMVILVAAAIPLIAGERLLKGSIRNP